MNTIRHFKNNNIKTDYKLVAINGPVEKEIMKGTWKSCKFWLNNNAKSLKWLNWTFKIKD